MNTDTRHPVVLITGAARRLGAETARRLHGQQYNVVIHCHHSIAEAELLCNELNTQRQNSARFIQANLADFIELTELAEQSIAAWGRLDALVNNASAFYPSPLASLQESQWDDLFASNAKAPLFLAQACASALKLQHGSIINISDLYARRGLSNHAIYTMAKAAQEAMTRSLARELAPHIRVNGVAPGAILWPSDSALSDALTDALTEEKKQAIIKQSALKKMGTPADIANAVSFLITKGTYITGQILHVDGGR